MGRNDKTTNTKRQREAYRKTRADSVKVKMAAKKRRLAEAEASGVVAPPVVAPHTLETLRTRDETIPDPGGEGDAEVREDEATDELSGMLDGSRGPPRVLITVAAQRVHAKTIGFCHQLVKVVPNSQFVRRRGVTIEKLVAEASRADFTAVVVVNEDQKVANSLLVVHLPAGPTALFRLSSVVRREKIKAARAAGPIDDVTPTVVANRFQTRLGLRVARVLRGLFPAVSSDVGTKAREHCRVVAFHNQRDYIFFRQHRYQLRRNATTGRPRLGMTELGPRFTLKLRYLQRGVFDARHGDYEWVHKRREQDANRRTFHL